MCSQLKKTTQLISLLVLSCLVNAEVNAIAVLRSHEDIYIRTPYLIDDLDKVWRLKVGSQLSNGLRVVDFIGERLIPADSNIKRTISEYHKTTRILRYGGDESPPVWVDGKIIGGNHLLNGQGTVHNYKFNMTLDGKVVKESDFQIGKVFRINETYLVSYGYENNILGEVKNSYKFSSNYYSKFQYT